ncbi:MAG TPA: ROK family protein [Candidatus Saccharimonadales bacterium]|nr:ROK family protein [Candidatus Saccharimonadales bacterium]
MYLGIDVGGTKTLVAALDNDGVIVEHLRFPTPVRYENFILELAKTIDKLTTKKFKSAGTGIPGRIDRKKGVAIGFGRLTWPEVPIKKDFEKITHCPVVIENDANLAGLSEAMLVKREYNRVLYVTIGTGIGTGIIDDQKIDPNFFDTEGGQILLEHGGRLQKWEDFASGMAIVKQFGKKARDIHDQNTWKLIATNIYVGLIDLIAVIQPEIIILGGGVSSHYRHFSKFLKADFKHYENVLVPIPPIIQAERPENAVLYGCYDLAKMTYG